MKYYIEWFSWLLINTLAGSVLARSNNSVQIDNIPNTDKIMLSYDNNFPQVIPAEVDHIDFTWEAKKGSAVPYKITFIHAPSRAMDNPSVNISTEGIVPTHTDKFRLYFPCTGKVAEQVETLFQVNNI